VEEFKSLGTTLTVQNSIPEEIKSRLKLGNACCHSVQNFLSSSLLSKNDKGQGIENYNLPVVLYGPLKIKIPSKKISADSVARRDLIPGLKY
jgi:hypothetical protein